MTTNETRSALGGLSQARVSQLVRQKILVAAHDPEGKLQIDRASVEREIERRKLRDAQDAEDLESRRAEHAAKQQRFERERKAAREAEAARQRHLDELQERQTIALERIAKNLERD